MVSSSTLRGIVSFVVGGGSLVVGVGGSYLVSDNRKYCCNDSLLDK